MSKDFALDRALALLAVALVLAALTLIWVARSTIAAPVYVSELGADGMATEGWFTLALLLIVAAGGIVAWTARRIRARLPLLRWGSPALSIAVSSAFFLLASQVSCTAGCPLPIQPGFFSLQDFVHTSSAVVAFAAACWGMLQCAAAIDRPLLARLSLAASIAVAVIAGAGGLMSVFRFHASIGAWFEFVAATIGLLWVTVLGLASAFEPARPRPVAPYA